MGLLGDDALRRRRALVESTTPTRAASISSGASVVAVEGVVRVHERRLWPPLSEATVVEPPKAATDASEATDAREAESGPTRLDELAAERDERRRGPPVLARYVRRPRGDGPEAAVETRVEAVPFVVEDDSGRVLVDARGADPEGVLLSPAVTERYLGEASGRVTPATGADDTRELARARAALGATPDWEHERATLRAGDQVYVLGRATGDPPRVEPGEEFVVSDLSRAALAEQLQRAGGALDRRFWLFAVGGAIAAVVVLITLAVLVDSFLL